MGGNRCSSGRITRPDRGRSRKKRRERGVPDCTRDEREKLYENEGGLSIEMGGRGREQALLEGESPYHHTYKYMIIPLTERGYKKQTRNINNFSVQERGAGEDEGGKGVHDILRRIKVN